MDLLPVNIREHFLSESISDSCGRALQADELWKIPGRSLPAQALIDQFEDMYALPGSNSFTRSRAQSSLPRSSSHSSVPEVWSRTGSDGV